MIYCVGSLDDYLRIGLFFDLAKLILPLCLLELSRFFGPAGQDLMRLHIVLLNSFLTIRIGVGQSPFASDDHGGDCGLIGKLLHI